MIGLIICFIGMNKVSTCQATVYEGHQWVCSTLEVLPLPLFSVLLQTFAWTRSTVPSAIIKISETIASVAP